MKNKYIGVALGVALAVMPVVALADSNVTATAGTGATVSPSGITVVLTGNTQVFVAGAQSGYRLSDVSVDGVSQGAVSSIGVIGDLTDHTVAVSATATGGGGLIYGSGPMAPGWDPAKHTNYVPYNGTTCPFQQGCMLSQ